MKYEICGPICSTQGAVDIVDHLYKGRYSARLYSGRERLGVWAFYIEAVLCTNGLDGFFDNMLADSKNRSNKVWNRTQLKRKSS